LRLIYHNYKIGLHGEIAYFKISVDISQGLGLVCFIGSSQGVTDHMLPFWEL